MSFTFALAFFGGKGRGGGSLKSFNRIDSKDDEDERRDLKKKVKDNEKVSELKPIAIRREFPETWIWTQLNTV